MRRNTDDTDREAQMHTLEGFAAAFLIVLSVLYAINSVAVTPTSTATASGGDASLDALVGDSLRHGKVSGDLRRAVLGFDTSATPPRFNGSTPTVYGYTGTSNLSHIHGDFNTTLERIGDRGVVYNVDLRFESNDTARIDERRGCEYLGNHTQTLPGEKQGMARCSLIDNGNPGKGAVTSYDTLVLYEDDLVNGTVPLANATREGYPIPNVDVSESDARFDRGNVSDIYNIVEVRLTAWR
ncbi:hypothetical protein ACEU6E_08850 [Halorutilales archaeon Cl-col2-1]